MAEVSNSMRNQREDTRTSEPLEREIISLETHRGLPVLEAEDYRRLYRIDAHSLGENSLTTFDFTGFVRGFDPEQPEKLIYRDVIATNGLLADSSGPGIHIGIDGIVHYDALTKNLAMTDPSVIDEYKIYITIPGALQRAHNCYCRFDCCYAVPERPDDLVAGDIKAAHEGEEGYLVIRLSLDPPEDPMAREKVQLLNSHLIRFVSDGGRLEEIADFVYDLQDELLELDPRQFQEKRATLLPPESAPVPPDANQIALFGPLPDRSENGNDSQ